MWLELSTEATVVQEGRASGASGVAGPTHARLGGQGSTLEFSGDEWKAIEAFQPEQCDRQSFNFQKPLCTMKYVSCLGGRL